MRALKAKQILIASTNAHKVSEIQAIVSSVLPETQFLSLKDVSHPSTVVEDGDSFEANAKIKAKAYGDFANMICLADDSGLCVDALDGAPGVFSARYAGESAKDVDNNRKLIQTLSLLALDSFEAHYHCAIALYVPSDQTFILSCGEVHGHIQMQARGSKGFGYDPYFIPKGFSKSMAELSEHEKNAISHRHHALAALAQKLKA